LGEGYLSTAEFPTDIVYNAGKVFDQFQIPVPLDAKVFCLEVSGPHRIGG